jgi:3-methyl-2-oxobutanoate hydroxymethyltransferase
MSAVSVSPTRDDRPHAPPTTTEARAPVTLRTLARMAERGEAFACLTAYDATTARYLERAGVHVLLAGDSAAQVVLGLPRTIDAPLDFLITITAAVKRGAPRTIIMADMPFLSYHTSETDALRNAGRFMTEGQADIVKIEADASFAPLVARMTKAGIPVCAHIGFRPQLTALTGTPQADGRTPEAIERLVGDARALEDAGAVMLLIEAVPPEAGRAVVSQAGVPVIGIGAGDAPHGQILVVHDLLGMTDAPPRFAEPVAVLGPAIEQAGREWVARVAARKIGGASYAMKSQSPGAAPDAAAASGAGDARSALPKKGRR